MRIPSYQLPHAPEAEAALLGCMLLDPASLPAIARMVSPEDWYDARHAQIYRALRSLHERYGTAWDGNHVVDSLRSRNALEDVGGTDYIAELLYRVSHATIWPTHAKVVAEKARLRRLVMACETIVFHVLRGSDEAPSLCRGAVESVAAAVREEGGAADIRLDDAERALLNSLDQAEPEARSTGMISFDQLLGGMPRSALVVMNGYTSCGKTTFSLQALRAWASSGGWVRVFSYEQPAFRVAGTVLSASAGIAVHELRSRGTRPTEEQRARLLAAVARDQSLNFEIVERSMNAAEIFTRCAEYRDKHGPEGAVLVDYLQNLPPMHQDRTQSTEESMRWLQRIPRELGLTCIVVSQVTRQAVGDGELRTPRLSDALGGMSIESKADVVMAIHRPHMHEAPPAEPGGCGGSEWAGWAARQRMTEVHVLKNKYGPRGVARLTFRAEVLRFE